MANAATMNISVLTPEKEIFSGAIVSVKVPGVSGQFQVLRNHAPIVSALQRGTIVIRRADGEVVEFGVDRGFIEVLNNEVSLLVRVSQPVPSE